MSESGPTLRALLVETGGTARCSTSSTAKLRPARAGQTAHFREIACRLGRVPTTRPRAGALGDAVPSLWLHMSSPGTPRHLRARPRFAMRMATIRTGLGHVRKGAFNSRPP